MGNFIFNGVSAADMGLRIARHPAIPKPRKKLQSVAIAGRSGELHVWDGSYEDVIIRYDCWWKNGGYYPTSFEADRIAQWLYKAPVGARLEDTYNPGLFRNATFVGPVDIEDVRNRYGRLTLEFKCAPQAYVKSSENGFPFTKPGGSLYNPTFPTKPLIQVEGSVSGLVQIGGESLLIRFEGYDDVRTLWIDCDTQESWEIIDGEEISRNEWITLQDYPTIQPGQNEVFIDGGITKVHIWPRYYTL